MKFKSSKKFISLFLSLLMIVTSVPAFAISASAAENTKYLFAYFTGNSSYQQNVRFALSEDGYTFTALNDNEPVVTQTQSTTSDTSAGCARDPYITRDPNGNGFYMVATDMDATGKHSSWNGDSCVYAWHSNDLVNWEQIADFDFRTFSGFENTIRAWAPQIIWDSAKNMWMMYLSITIEPNWNVMYYTYTSDFQTFTTPEKFEFSTGVYTGRIDADIVENNGTYYMYYKDETANKIMLATADSLTGTYTPYGVVSSNLSSKNVEGNAMYQLGNSGTWVMMLDEYSDGSFAYGTTTDFKNFTKYTGSTSANAKLSARHGSVMQITDEEYNRLKTATFNNASEPTGDGVDLSDCLAAQYLTTSDVTADNTGKGHNLTSTGTVSWNGTGYSSDFGAASFTNGNYLHTADLKSIIGNSATGFSVSFYGYRDSSCDSNGRFIEFSNKAPKSYSWTSGDTDCVLLTNWATNSYEFMKDTYVWNTGRFGDSNGGQANNSWHLYTITYDSTAKTICRYVDGTQVTNTTNDKLDSSFLSALSYINIGSSCYTDNTLTGMLRDLRIYNRAITSDEASKLPKQYQLDGETEKKQYIIDNINNSKSYSFNTKVNNADDTYMKNIVYSSDLSERASVKINDFDEKTSNYNNFKIIAPEIAVGIYTGSDSDIRFPMTAQNNGGGNGIGKTTYIGIDHLSFNNGTFGVGGDTWTRCSAWNDMSSNSDTSHDFSSSSSANVVRNDKTNTQATKKFKVTETKSWKNYIKYYGSGNTTNYYDVLTASTFAYQADYSISSLGWYYFPDHTYDITSSENFYVINVKPLKDLIESASFKSNFQNVVDNEWKYDEQALADYYDMYYKLLTFDLSSQDYSSTSAVENVASTIKALVASYYSEPTTLKTFTIKFVKANNTEIDKTVTAGNTLSGLIPDVTVTKNNNNGTHDVYSWPEDCTASVMPKKDLTFYEEATTHDCTYNESTSDGVTTKVCSVCGYTTTEYHFNLEAYNAAVAEAQAAVENTAKYTEASRNALQTVLNNNSSANAKSQTELDNMTKAIVEATNALELNTYTVKLYKVINNESPEFVGTYSGKYGEDVTLDSQLDDSYTVTKWTKTVDGADEKVGSSNSTLLSRYYADVDYYVYASKAEAAADNSALVTLTDRTGRVVDNMYVGLTDGSATVTVKPDLANKTVYVNGTALKAIDLTFYTITGFKIGDTVLQDGVETQVDITKDLTISTVYDISKSFNITSSDNSCTPNVSSAYWDQKVTVTAENTTANTKWIVNDVVVAYGTTYVFRATKDADIKCVTDSSASATATATIESLSYNSPTEKTITVVGSFNVPADCEVIEKGALLKTSAVNKSEAVKDISNYTGDNANARKFIATNYVKDTNQYAINIYSSKAYTSLCVGAVAYVTYKDASGHVETKYSNLVTIDYNA